MGGPDPQDSVPKNPSREGQVVEFIGSVPARRVVKDGEHGANMTAVANDRGDDATGPEPLTECGIHEIPRRIIQMIRGADWRELAIEPRGMCVFVGGNGLKVRVECHAGLVIRDPHESIGIVLDHEDGDDGWFEGGLNNSEASNQRCVKTIGPPDRVV